MKKIFLPITLLLILFLAGCSENSITQDASEKIEQKALEAIMPADAAEFLIYMQKSLTHKESMIAYEDDGTLLISAVYNKEGKLRTENSINGLENRVYIFDGKNIHCTKLSAGWECIEFEDLAAGNTTTSYDDIDITEEEINDTGKTDIKKDGTMQIAGTTAACFLIKDREAQSDMRYCFAKDGFLVYSKITSEEEVIELKAKAYSTKVDDSEFIPPATPVKGTLEANLAFLKKIEADPNYKKPVLFGDLELPESEDLEALTQLAQEAEAQDDLEGFDCASLCEGLEGDDLSYCMASC